MTPLRATQSGQLIELQSWEWPGEAPSLSVLLYQPPSSDARWRLSVEVLTENGSAVIGELVTRAPAAGAQTSRVVAIASCPGGRGWRVLATLESGTPDPGEFIDLAASPCCLSRAFQAPGGDAVAPGGALALGAPVFDTLEGVDGVAVVPAGAIVTGISASTTQAGASIDPGTGAVPVPQNGATELSPAWWTDPDGNVNGSLRDATITFTNTDGYVVEFVR